MSFPRYPKYKPSGVEWLGDVPEHWDVLPCRGIVRERTAKNEDGSCEDYLSLMAIRMNNLRRGRLDLSEAARIPDQSCNDGAALMVGDLVWGMSGSVGETGSLGNYARVGINDVPCQLNQRVGRFAVVPSKLITDFLEWVIQASCFYEQVLLLVTGTAQFNVSSEQVESCTVALPTLEEQERISDWLKSETAKLDALTAEAERAIELLQERRTALISAAVTGRIDVREFSRGVAGNAEKTSCQ
jgi:type I restriction enzyme S subunit